MERMSGMIYVTLISIKIRYSVLDICVFFVHEELFCTLMDDEGYNVVLMRIKQRETDRWSK